MFPSYLRFICRMERIIIEPDSACGKFAVTVERPTIDGDLVVTKSEIVALLNGMDLADNALTVSSLSIVGVCKNRLCEHGERLNSGTEWECPTDCVNIDPVCTIVNGRECGHFGICDRGECTCFKGYQGENCTTCQVDESKSSYLNFNLNQKKLHALITSKSQLFQPLLLEQNPSWAMSQSFSSVALETISLFFLSGWIPKSRRCLWAIWNWSCG